MFCDSYMFDTYFKVLGIFSEEDWSDEVRQIAPSLLRKNSTLRDPTHSYPACSHLHTSDHLILIHIPTWWAQRWTLTLWCRIKSTRIIHRWTIHIYRLKTVFTESIQIQHISTLFRTMTVQKCKWPRDLAIRWMLYQHLLQNRLFPTQWCQKKRMVNLSLWSQQKAATQRWVMWMSAWGTVPITSTETITRRRRHKWRHNLGFTAPKRDHPPSTRSTQVNTSRMVNMRIHRHCLCRTNHWQQAVKPTTKAFHLLQQQLFGIHQQIRFRRLTVGITNHVTRTTDSLIIIINLMPLLNKHLVVTNRTQNLLRYRVRRRRPRVNTKQGRPQGESCLQTSPSTSTTLVTVTLESMHL